LSSVRFYFKFYNLPCVYLLGSQRSKRKAARSRHVGPSHVRRSHRASPVASVR